jgi:hypothetical protein
MYVCLARLQASFACRARRLPSAALDAAWGSSLDHVPRAAAASLSSSSGVGSSARAPWALQVGAVGGQVRPPGAAAAPLRPLFLVQRQRERHVEAPWTMFRARRRRWARAAGRGVARQPPYDPGSPPPGPVRNHLRSIPFETRLLATWYRQARHHKTEMVSTGFQHLF